MRFALLSFALILFASGCSPRLKVVEQKQKEVSVKIDALGETIISGKQNVAPGGIVEAVMAAEPRRA